MTELVSLHFSLVFLKLPLVLLLDSVLRERLPLVHPVVLMGRLVSFLESFLRKILNCEFDAGIRVRKTEISENVHPSESHGRKFRERLAGGVLVLSVCSVSFFLPLLVLLLVLNFPSVLSRFGVALPSLPFRILCFLISVFWGYQSVSAGGLLDEAANVRSSLESSLEEGRAAVSRIVGRDTGGLSRSEVVRACVESVAESATDGVFSPIFFYFLGGAPLALFFKAASTMDSMVGYRNARYRFFGTAAARLDDVLNFLPARLCAAFMILSSPNRRRAARIFLRDRLKHESPNSAQSESAMAGILGISLGGGSFYSGVFEPRPVIGGGMGSPDTADIGHACRVVCVSASVFVAFLSICATIFL